MAKKVQLPNDLIQDADAYIDKLVRDKEELDSVQAKRASQPPEAEPRVPSHRMLVVTGKATGVYVPIPEGDALSIGRDSACDIRLKDESASREHAEIQGQDGSCALRDLGSANGTFVNGQRVSNHTLADGDVVLIGATRMIFCT